LDAKVDKFAASCKPLNFNKIHQVWAKKLPLLSDGGLTADSELRRLGSFSLNFKVLNLKGLSV
jgi:hypothetical protein